MFLTPVCDFIYANSKRDKNRKDKNNRCKFFTGLDELQLKSLWDFLGEARTQLTLVGRKPDTLNSTLRNISPKCQFLLTLMILRRNYTFKEIAMTYNIGVNLVSQIFKTWLQFMYFKFRDLKDLMFVRKDDIKKPLPRHFRNKMLKGTRCVIDCTEIVTETTTQYRQQGNLYSLYKHRTTSKTLIAVLPSGGACFISDCFEGAISDKEIVKQSGFLTYLEPGDVILADRGFNCELNIREMGSQLLIPPFLHGRPQFTLEETQLTKVLTKARIHIERYNQRFKIYEFLRGPIPQYHLAILSQAVTVCCFLANFSPILAE
jgi:hypothetical protein